MEPYKRLEFEYAEFCKNPHTVACSSGTAALHLAMETLKSTEVWLKGTKIMVPDFAMIACARAVTLARMEPEFVDVDELGLLDTSKIGEEPRIVMAVHTYGRRCPTTTIRDSVIEDLAEAHGILPNPDSLAACWSFYKNKIIAGEEGGMVAFATEEQQTLAKKLRNMGFEDDQNFRHIPRGMNYRMSNCHARMVLDSLHDYPVNRSQRIDIEGWYDEYCPKEWKLPLRDVPWVYDLNLPQEVNIEKVVRDLNTMGIEARCGFKPLSQQKEYETWTEPGTPVLPFPINPMAEKLSRTRMYLPINIWLTKPLVRGTMEALKRTVGSCEKSPI